MAGDQVELKLHLIHGRQQLDASEGCCDEQIYCKNEVWFSLGGNSKHMAQLRLCKASHTLRITGSLATRPVSDGAPPCVLALRHQRRPMGCNDQHRG
jgi:hypothetical protein